MKRTYCATVFLYDGQVIDDSVLDSLVGEVFETKFANSPTKIELYKEGDSLMGKWVSRVLIPDDAYYLDCTIAAKADIDGKITEIDEFTSLSISPSHASGFEGCKKINKFYKPSVTVTKYLH